jgi:hypothetical protein
MKKLCVLVGVSLGLSVSTVSADALKNSLTNIMNEKDAPSMVDLGNINLNAKPRPVKKVRKTRSAKAVVATVNGHKILKKETDAYLSQRTGGKVKNFDNIPANQKRRLIQEISLPILVADAADKGLSDVEKEAIYTRTWMQKEALKLKISDDQVLEVYNQISQEAKDNNNTANIPAFDTIKDKLRIQMIEKTIVGKLMENIKIEVLD